jgi:hypothetical protein
LELLKDYDMDIKYTLGKANLAADALSQKSFHALLLAKDHPPELVQDLYRLNLQVVEKGFLANLEVNPSLHDQVKEAQLKSVSIQKNKENIKSGQGKFKCFTEDADGSVVWATSCCD